MNQTSDINLLIYHVKGTVIKIATLGYNISVNFDCSWRPLQPSSAVNLSCLVFPYGMLFTKTITLDKYRKICHLHCILLATGRGKSVVPCSE